MKNTLLTLVVFSFFLSGCATNYYVNEDRYTQPKNYEKISVYVTNPEHEAYEVLKKSEIYDLTPDNNKPDKLTLIDFSPWARGCGLGGLITIYTLGLVPSGGDDYGNFVYSLESGQTTQLYRHKIIYRDSLSAWSVPMRPFAYSEKGAQAKALSLSTRDLCTDFEKCQSESLH
ncbi:MAG: hypothetical protein KA099_06385 [Alphaproteobacteria bacterium]|nr:hypothetical protein [Alphaproteobacteria bacterium]MBP7759903.1 hypothetical protein [Alphaproteobacteria bacterium]MBP7763254.1 hypothetical protein [Alphaproteobacteria bacterium]MBP7904937.1 hypothetical protein [Alphaproteobacteria bacterium]